MDVHEMSTESSEYPLTDDQVVLRDKLLKAVQQHEADTSKQLAGIRLLNTATLVLLVVLLLPAFEISESIGGIRGTVVGGALYAFSMLVSVLLAARAWARQDKTEIEGEDAIKSAAEELIRSIIPPEINDYRIDHRSRTHWQAIFTNLYLDKDDANYSFDLRIRFELEFDDEDNEMFVVIDCSEDFEQMSEDWYVTNLALSSDFLINCMSSDQIVAAVLAHASIMHRSGDPEERAMGLNLFNQLSISYPDLTPMGLPSEVQIPQIVEDLQDEDD